MRTVLFHVLNAFRGLIQLGLRLCSGVAAIMVIIGLLSDGLGSRAFGAAVFLVLFGAASWYYDVLVLKLAPAGDERGAV